MVNTGCSRLLADTASAWRGRRIDPQSRPHTLRHVWCWPRKLPAKAVAMAACCRPRTGQRQQQCRRRRQRRRVRAGQCASSAPRFLAPGCQRSHEDAADASSGRRQCIRCRHDGTVSTRVVRGRICFCASGTAHKRLARGVTRLGAAGAAGSTLKITMSDLNSAWASEDAHVTNARL